MPVARQVWRASESRGSSHLALWLLRLRLRPEFRIPTAEYVGQIPLRTIVLVCSKRCAPRKVHCICCFLTNRLLTTWLIVDSTNAVLMFSPCRRRSPEVRHELAVIADVCFKLTEAVGDLLRSVRTGLKVKFR